MSSTTTHLRAPSAALVGTGTITMCGYSAEQFQVADTLDQVDCENCKRKFSQMINNAEPYIDQTVDVPVFSLDFDKNTHYDAGGIGFTDIVRAKLTPDQLIGGYLFNANKYLLRCNHKGSFWADIEKAHDQLGLLLACRPDDE